MKMRHGSLWIQTVGIDMKTCTKCGKTKPLVEFVFRKDAQSYRGHCLECEKERAKQSFEKHREQKLQKRKERYQQNKEHELAMNKAWSDANKERHKELSARHYKANKHLYAYRCSLGRALKRSATPKWLTSAEKKAIQTEYELSAWCSAVMGLPYEVDHIIPLQGKKVCGLHVPWNLQVIPRSENRRKLNKFEVS